MKKVFFLFWLHWIFCLWCYDLSFLSLDGDYFLFILFYIPMFFDSEFCLSWGVEDWGICSLNFVSLWLYLFFLFGNLTEYICIRLYENCLLFIFHVFISLSLFQNIQCWVISSGTSSRSLLFLQLCLIFSLTHPFFSLTFNNCILNF